MEGFKQLTGLTRTLGVLGKAFPALSAAITGIIKALSSGSSVIKAFGSGLLGIASAHPFIALAAGIMVAVGAFDVFTESASEANEKMRTSFDSYQEAKTNLDNVNTELEEVNSRMSELEGKGSLTIVEQGKLERLKEVNEQLLIQQDLLEREANKKAREAAKDTVNAYEKNFKEDISADKTKEYKENANITGNNAILLSDEKDISAQIAALSQFSDLRKEALAEYNKAKEADDEGQMDWWGEEIKRYDEMNTDIKDNIFDQVKSLQEYRDILAQLPKDELAKIDGGKETLAQIDEQIEYVYSTLDPAKWNEIKFGEIFKNEDFANARTELENLANASNGLGITVDDVREKYPELAKAIESAGLSVEDFVNSVNSGMSSTGDSVEQTAETISSSFSDAASSATTLQNEIDAVQKIIAGQQSGKSISFADYNSDELKDYQSALEYVNGTMQLNAEKTREIAKAKAEEEIATHKANKEQAQSKYFENAKEIASLREALKDAKGAEKESINSSINALLAENSAIAETCNQYDILTASIEATVSAYSNWLNSQNASDYGDMANDAVSAIERIRNTYNEKSDIFGDFGSKKFDAAVEFIVPDSVDTDDLSAIESYMADFKQYLNFDKNGNADSLDVDKFLEKSVKAGLMSYSDDEGFKVLGGKKMEDFAEGLNMSSGMVQAFFDELQLKGADFDWSDEAGQSFADLAMKANEAAESMKNVKQFEDLKLVLDVSGFENETTAIQTLESNIKSLQDKLAQREELQLDDSQVQDAVAVIQYCVAQKQILSQPDVMTVDTSQVTGSIGEVLALLQEFQSTQDTIEMQAAVGADTSEAEAKLSSLTSQIQKVDIPAGLAIDPTSTATIQDSISNLKAKMIVDCDVDPSLVAAYQAEEHNSDGMVIWDNNTSKVDSYASSEKKGTGVVVWGNNTVNVKTHFTATGTINWSGSGGVHKLNGTAHASGTALASGDWGTAKGGNTLVGELGQEIVVDPKTGRWYTVGDTGAEFRDIPPGAIVFNHVQSKALLENGYVSGRASALVSGTAMVTGGYKPYKPSGSTSTSNKNTASQNSSYKKPSSSGSTSTKSYNSSKEKDDFEESIDWVEVALKRIGEAIDRLKIKAESTFKTLTKRNSAAADEIAMLTEEIDLQNAAYNKYMQQANAIGLSDSWKKKVQNGSIEISTITDKDLAEKIKDFQDFYDKAIECKDAVAELHEEIAQLYADRFDNISSDFENQLSLVEHLTNTYNTGMEKLEAEGLLGSKKYYEALQKAEKENQKILKQELVDLTEAYNQAMASGEIEKGSEQWYEMQKAINDVKEMLDESVVSVLEFEKAIRELDWSYFDFLQERIASITDESDFLIELMSNGKLFDDKGNMTDSGTATMGLHGQNYNVYMNQADQYAKEAQALSEQLANDPTNTDLLLRREELLELQRESILSAEDEKRAIVDLVEEGIQLQIDSMNDLIDKYLESLDSAKDLYDFQKKVKDQTSEIASLQKQLSAYKNDTSEEARSKIQKIEVDLTKAMEELEETQYDQYITDQKKLMDQLSLDYETFLNQRLDNVDALISETIDTINLNSSDIMSTLERESANVGYSMSEALNAIWSNEGGANSIITKYGESFTAQLTSVNAALKICADYVTSLVNKANAEAQSKVDSTQKETPTSKPTTPTTKPPSTTTSTPKGTQGDGKIQVGDKVTFTSGQYYYSSDGRSPVGSKYRGKQVYVTSINNASWASKPYHISTGSKLGSGDLGWLTKGQISGYASGLKKATKDEDAWVNELGTESIISPTNRAIITHVDKNDSVLNHDATENIWDMANDPSGFINGHLWKNASLSEISGSKTENNYSLENINFSLPDITSPEEFIRELQNNKTLERMFQAMTVGRISGGSKLDKYKYKF